MTLIVCPLSCVDEIVGSRRPSHVLTLVSPTAPQVVFSVHPPEHYLRLNFHDVTEPGEGMTVPDEHQIKAMLAFGAGWNGVAPMLIHCWAGISRSTAAAFVLACERNPGVPERYIALTLRHRAPSATPNRLMVTLADDLLSRGGRMADAAAHIGRGTDALEGSPFEFPARFDDKMRSIAEAG